MNTNTSSSPTPSRTSTSLSGGGLVLAIAALLGLTPWLPGFGWGWTALLVVGGLSLWSGKLIAPLVPAVAAIGVGATVYLSYLGIGMLPWILASVLLLQGLGAQVEWSRARSGYRLVMAAACAVCVLALRMVWLSRESITTSMSMGSLDLTFGWAPSTIVGTPGAGMSWYYQYNPRYMPWIIPGYEISGRGVNLSLFACFALAFLVLWSLWADESARRKLATPALWVGVFLVAWASTHATLEHQGPIAFMIGALAMLFAAWKLGRGEESGEFDLEDIARRAQSLRKQP